MGSGKQGAIMALPLLHKHSPKNLANENADEAFKIFLYLTE